MLSITDLLHCYLCPECFSTFSFIEKPYCQKCGKQLLRRNISGLPGSLTFCADCSRKERVYRQCRSLINYDETAQEIMADIKYHAKTEYVHALAALAAERLGPWIQAVRPDAFVPVPIHPDRRIIRGYNQAELLAETLSDVLAMTGDRRKIPVRSSLLIRTKRTEAQKGLTAERRLLNLQNAFEATDDLREWPRKPRLILIDDIYTTGATLNACAEELLHAGAAEVYGICIAAGMDVS